MSFYPVLPPLLLAIVAAVAVVARIASLRQLLSARRRTRTQVWRWAGVTAAVVLLLIAAARPVFGDDLQTTPAGAADGQPNVFLVVDRSPEMGVGDLPDGRTRMDAAREDIAAVVDRYPDARFAVIAFASGPSLEWPLSQDTWSLRSVLAAMEPYGDADVALTNVAAAGNVLRYQLIGARQQFPRANNLVFYVGSGASASEAPQRRFDVAEGSVDGGAVLGYGTTRGAPLPGSQAERSTLDEPRLRAVAEQLGVPFVQRDGTGDTAAMFGDAGEPPQESAVTASARPTEIYWAPAMLAAALLLLELSLTLRDLQRSRTRAVVT